MFHRWFLAAGLAAACWFAYERWSMRAIATPPGFIVPVEPVQRAMAPLDLGERDGQQIIGVADYGLTVRVLSTRRYHDRGSNVAPIDVAVAWGGMSDQAVLDRLDVSQGFRFFFYEWQGQPPLPLREMQTHSANMHMIPATPDLARALRHLRRGEVVAMHGKLVNVRGPQGQTWSSSLSRDDVGNGACELFYLEAIRFPELAGPAHLTAR